MALSNLEQLARYESAGAAMQFAETDAGLAINAMQNFYDNFFEERDPIIHAELERAKTGVRAGTGISSDTLVQSIHNYGGVKFGNTYLTTPISELIEYSSSGYVIPERTLKAMNEFKNSTLDELAKRLKIKNISEVEKKKIENIISAFMDPKEGIKHRTLSQIGMGVTNYSTTGFLYSLFPEKKDEKKK